MNSVYRVFRVIIDFIFKFSSFIHKRQESICNGKKKRRSFLKVQYKSYHQTCVSVIEFIKTAKHLVTFIESKQQYFWRNFNLSQRLQSCLYSKYIIAKKETQQMLTKMTCLEWIQWINASFAQNWAFIPDTVPSSQYCTLFARSKRCPVYR